MVEEWKIGPSSRRCFRCQTGIEPEEEYYSAIVRREEGIQRSDYCRACWEDGGADPTSAFAFWRTRWTPVPPRGPRRIRFDPEVALEFFRRLGEDDREGDEGRKLRYLLGLLLFRRKVLVLQRTEDCDGARILWFAEKDGPVHPVGDPGLPADELATVRGKLAELLDIDLPEAEGPGPDPSPPSG
ncbi:MAG: hypothetical protein JXP34_06360 [Planctomycetes bacterium]|nr:hypothetical protein [Planctomycetota bacterium]